MDQKVLDFVTEKTHELIAAKTCCKELKEAAEAWLRAVGSAQEMEETKKYLAELEEDIMPIDNLIGFAGSDAGAALFGAEASKNIEAHAKEIKANGANYCDCPACAACEAILSKKEELLK